MKTTRRTPKAHKFHPVQNAYFLARATYDAAKEAYAVECKATGNELHRGMSDADVDRVCEAQENIRERVGLGAASTAKIEAERAMVAWSVDVAIALAPSEADTLRDLAKRATLHATVWEKMVDAASRLSS
jgi:hypothetical protein